jgi:hypothetical protein
MVLSIRTQNCGEFVGHDASPCRARIELEAIRAACDGAIDQHFGAVRVISIRLDDQRNPHMTNFTDSVPQATESASASIHPV